MKPRNYSGKGRGEKLPLFDLEYLEGIEGSVMLCMSRRARMAILQCIAPLSWPTRWKDTERTEDIDTFVEEVNLSLAPVEGCVLLDTEALFQQIKELIDMSQVVVNVGGGGGCGCGCGGGGGGSYQNASNGLPTIAPPESAQEFNVDLKCVIATFFVDDFEDKITRMSGFSLVAAVSLSALITLCVTVIQPAVGIFLTLEGITLLWALVASLAETGGALSQFSQAFGDYKEEIICRLYSLPVLSAETMKASMLLWTREKFVDGSPSFLFFYAMFLMYRYSLLYDSSVTAGYVGRCDDCGSTEIELDPRYGLARVQVEYVETYPDYPGGDVVASSPSLGELNYSATLQPNGNFFFPRFVLRPAPDVDVSNVVGLYMECLEATRNASPVVKTSIRGIALFDGEPSLGQLEAGRGYVGLMTNGNETLETDVSSYFQALGATIVLQPSLGTDDDVVLNDENFNGRDKVNSGGTGGRLTVRLKFWWLFKVL